MVVAVSGGRDQIGRQRPRPQQMKQHRKDRDPICSLVGTRNSATDLYSTVIHDLEHPLNILTKPVSALNVADANRVRPHLNPSSGTGDTYPLTATEQAVLEAAVEACKWAPKVNGGG